MKKIMFAVVFIIICLALGSTLYRVITKEGNTNETVSPLNNQKPIQLVAPQIEGGRPLMKVLKDRKTSRSFSDKKLPPQILSNLLWATFGINRPDSGKRTAPSAGNWQETDIYVAMPEGLYLFDAKANQLKAILAEDIRTKTSRLFHWFVRKAPVHLIYVADYSRMGLGGSAMPEKDKIFFSATHTGFISQNAYLYCASEGLSTMVRAMVDREELGKAMRLRENQKITLVQTVGYPQE